MKLKYRQEETSPPKLPEFMQTNCALLGGITEIYQIAMQNFNTYTMIV